MKKLIVSTLLAVSSLAFAHTSSLGVVTAYYKWRWPSVTSADSVIPRRTDFTYVVQKLNQAGLPAPKAPSTVDWAIQKKGCEGERFTPRCVSAALDLAAELDKNIKD